MTYKSPLYRRVAPTTSSAVFSTAASPSDLPEQRIDVPLLITASAMLPPLPIF